MAIVRTVARGAYGCVCSGAGLVGLGVVPAGLFLPASRCPADNFNICGRAPQACLPASWTNTYVYGPTIQTWGATPQCNPPGACTNPANQSASCCSAECQVLSTGDANVALRDKSNPATGGIVITYQGVPTSASDPFW